MKVAIYSDVLDLAKELIGLANQLNAETELILIGTEPEGIIGVDRVLLYREASPEDQELVLEVLKEVEADLYLLSNDRRGRELVGLLAHLKGGASIVDATNVTVEGDKVIAERMTLGGKGVAVEEAKLPAVISVMPGKYKPPEDGKSPEIVEREPPAVEKRIELIDKKEKPKAGVPLDKADVVIAVGRGFKKKEDLKIAYELAEILGGVVGATRPLAADLKWMPEEVWIGISGVRIRPKLLIVIGASGQQQFSAGIMDSKVVVAINNDEKAPIFEVSDYGIVADLYEAVPKLIEKLKR